MPQTSILRSLQLLVSRRCRVDGQPYPTLWTLYKHGELAFLHMWPGPIAGTSNSANNVDRWIELGFRFIWSQLQVTNIAILKFQNRISCVKFTRGQSEDCIIFKRLHRPSRLCSVLRV